MAINSRNITLPIKVASIGDSTANIESVQNTTDLTQITVNGATFSNNKIAGHISYASQGLIQFVANCGISGDTTTGLLTRDTSAASTTRKAITDAALIGAQIALVSVGINDLRNGINSGTSSGTASALVTTTLGNIQTIMMRCFALGMWPMYKSISGQTYGSQAQADGKSSADIAAINTYALSLNSQVKSWIEGNTYGQYIDTSAQLANQSTFNYNAGMSNDGLHTSQTGAMLEGQIVSAAILAFYGNPPKTNLLGLNAKSSLPYMPTNSIKNLFTNPLFVNASAGQATGITISLSGINGTNNLTTKAINVLNNAPVQDLTITPQTFDPNGIAAVKINMLAAIIGATPTGYVAPGDILIGQCDVVIDNGSGAAATNVTSYGTRMETFGPSNMRVDQPTYDQSTAHEAFSTVFSGRLTSAPLQMNDISANITAAEFCLFVAAISTTPYRVRIQNIIIVKIPRDKSDIQNTGIVDSFATASDANYTTAAPGRTIKLPTVTANRTFTLPTAATYTGQRIALWNQNTSGTFNWSFTGSTAKDKTNSTFTALTNGQWYIMESDGTNWNQIN